jgi:hypothetical protein
LVITIPSLEIFLFCQHNSTGGGNLELSQAIQGDFESCAEILTTSYWLHAELGKNI